MDAGIRPEKGRQKWTAEKEHWRPIAGFEGWYEVSNLGRVRGVRREHRPKQRLPICLALTRVLHPNTRTETNNYSTNSTTPRIVFIARDSN